MPDVVTIGRVLVDAATPEDMRHKDLVFDKGTAGAYFAELAKKHPDEYEDVLHKLNQIARVSGTEYGNTASIRLSDLQTPPRLAALRRSITDKIDLIAQNPSISKEEKNERIEKTMRAAMPTIMDTLKSEVLNDKNSFGESVKLGVRGSPTQLAQILFGDMLVADHKGKAIPIPGVHGYGEGVTPMEYWAGTYGSRKGYCLDENTLVCMGNYTTKRIGDIQKEDIVLASDKRGNTFPAHVVDVHYNGIKEMFLYTFSPEEHEVGRVQIAATPEHKVLAHKGDYGTKCSLKEIQDNGYLIYAGGGTNFSLTDVQPLGMRTAVDLELGTDDHLFVLANGMVVSNSDVQFATAKAGFLGKQLALMAQRVKVTGEDCGATNTGVVADGDDPEIIGSVLARDVKGIPAGTVIEKGHLPMLKGTQPLVRSVISCQQEEGVCQKCVGKHDQHKFYPVGSSVGISSARTAAEPLVQVLGLCLCSETTYVRMADFSEKLLRDIRPGDMVLGANKQAETFPVKVKAVHDNGMRAVNEYTYRKGSSRKETLSLICTEDHKVLTMTRGHTGANSHLNGRLRLLPAGYEHSRLASVLAGSYVGEDAKERVRDGLLIGMLLGDGCYTKAIGTVNFSCADDMLVEDLVTYLAQFSLKLHKLGTKYYWKVSSTTAKMGRQNKTDGKVYAGSYTNYARRRLAELGMLGKYAHEKRIPDVAMLNWDNDSIADVLAGLWITDGSIYKAISASTEHYGFSSTSLELVEQVAFLLRWRFGIYTGEIDTQKPERRKRPLHSITIGGRYSVMRMRNVLMDRLLGIKRQTLLNMVALPSSNNRTLSAKHGCLLTKAYRCNRLSIEPMGMRHTMDLEVAHPDHLFVLANGMIVSNSAKHTGGVVGTNDNNVSGFDEINQFLQVPKSFRGASVLAPADGKVQQISDAPQGGKYMHVSGQQVYVPDGRELLVKKGDTVEAGDMLTDGTPHPGEIAKYKGLGEGRIYFLKQFSKILKDNGVPTHRRHIETLSRAFYDKVRVTAPEGVAGYGMEDSVSYGDIQRAYEPRPGSENLVPSRSVGRYLEKPVLHYTIGTRVTPTVADNLKKQGVADISVHKEPPGFEPEVIRVMDISAKDRDWKTRMAGFNLRKSFLDAARRGSTSPHESTSYVNKLMDPSAL